MQTSSVPNLAIVRTGLPPMRAPRTAIVIVLIAAADFLFVDRTVGISLSVFLGLVALAALAGNRHRGTTGDVLMAGAALVVGLIPSIEAAGLLSTLYGVAAVAVFVLGATGRLHVPWPVALRRVAALMTMDVAGRLARMAKGRCRWASGPRRLFSAVGIWVVPVAVGAVFTGLFSIANPVFLSWVAMLDPLWLLEDLQPGRYAFWLLVALFVTPFVRLPAFRRPWRAAPRADRGDGQHAIGDGTVLRTLIVVNLIFALQTGLDVLYLWSGAELPEGVTPAENAQQAAYILVVSALLAAVLVLIAAPDARRSDGRVRLVRAFVHLWIAQNVVLVASAIFRLVLYVESYALTELRIAAFIWMGLVIAGLILIESRIALGKTGAWLVKANLIALGITFYGCALADLRGIVADYNVEHSRELAGEGAPLDRGYLCALGRSALPAIERFIRSREDGEASMFEPDLRTCAARFRLTLARNSTDWRAWSFRDHRLRHSIDLGAYIPARPDHGYDDPRGG